MDTPSQGRFPVLPVRDTVVFPRVAVPLRIGRPASRAAVAHALARGDHWILTIAQKPGAQAGDGDANSSDLYRVGTLCKIDSVKGNEKDGYQLLVRGVARFKVLDFKDVRDGEKHWLEAQAEPWQDVADADESTADALKTSLKSLVAEILELVPADTRGLKELLQSLHDSSYLMDLCAVHLDIAPEKKQEILETVSLKARALMLLGELQTQKEALEVQGEIRDKLSHKVGKMQRDAILREQMKTIREELGESGEQKDQDDLRVKIDKAGMPGDARKVALEELKRLEAIGTSSPEAHVIRNYLDLLCALPWSKPEASESNDDMAKLDLVAARTMLDADHFGLDRIKKRIIQHLAVMKLKKSSRGSILLLVGPPGTGKTSLGESIARAMGRKFVRGSLGGVRDDAEIRGHRRTYIGAMPGRIIQAIKRAGANNPVFLLDEIDKLGRGYQGDPAAALLEVLDPEQNATFLDHYLDVPFDLSKVFFIATANSLDSIPGPLLDRMEVIELSGYTTAEKLHIAKNHLIPKQYKEFGLDAAALEFSDEVIQRLITHYTREAGVRGLQRQIASLARAATEQVVSAAPEELPVKVDESLIEETLGGERFNHEEAAKRVPPGVVTGLAWTPMGGEILFVEGGLMPGQGRLTLTGQLGDVMKESAHIALSIVRSRLPSVVTFDYDKKDLHIHVPAGAIPKDGPSAGVTMLTTIASLFSGRPVDSKLAMTGEITLRGAVTPVGGIKEKLIAAHRAGITRVLLPKRNERDLKEVPAEVKAGLKIEFVETASDVLRLALGIEVGLAGEFGLTAGQSAASPAVACKAG